MESRIDATHAPSLLPEGKRWNLVWNDEFDGDILDRTKWDFRLYLMQRRHSTFTDEGATLDGDSHLLLNLIERDGHYYSPHLQTGSNYLDVRTRYDQKQSIYRNSSFQQSCQWFYRRRPVCRQW